jgi:hypothetical protein
LLLILRAAIINREYKPGPRETGVAIQANGRIKEIKGFTFYAGL